MRSAVTAFERRHFLVAVETCGEVLLHQSDHREALDLRGRACKSLKDHAGALQSWIALQDNVSPMLWKRIRMFYTLIGLKRYEEARTIVIAAQEQWPDEPRLLCHMTAVHQGLCERKEIILIWTKINALESDVIRDLVQESFYSGFCGRVARAYVNIQQYSEAAQICNQMLDLAADSREALTIQLEIHRRRKDWEKTLHIFQTLSENYPNELQFLRQQIFLLGRLGKSEQAEQLFHQAKSSHGDNAQACAQLALIAESQMWIREGKEFLQTALELAPTDTELLVCLIEGYWGLDRVDMPLYLMKKLEALSPKTFSANATVMNILALLRIASVEDGLLHGTGRMKQKIYRTELVAKAIVDRVGKNKPVKAKAIYKIAMISQTMLHGGAERQVATCLNSLSKDREHRFDVCLYLESHDVNNPDLTFYPDILHLPIKLKEFRTQADWDIMDHADSEQLQPWSDILRFLPRNKMQQVAQLVYLFHEQKPDIVHAWQDEINIAASLAALIAGVPRILLSARTLAPRMGKKALKLKPYNLRSHSWRAAYRYLLQNPGICLCHNSSAGAESYRVWLDDPLLKMPVIYNGVDFDGIAKASESAPVGESNDKVRHLRRALVVGTVMRIESVKQPFLWIDAAKIVNATLPECKFLIVGGGSMLEDCKQRVNKLGMSDSFVFSGPSTKVKAWLELVDVFLMTSDTEGLPNALIEAQGFGVPAVCTDAGGAREVIIDGITGRITTGDASAIAATIVSCLEDQEWLRVASSAATFHARQTFSVSGMHSRLKELYDLKEGTDQKDPHSSEL